ncbi:MAG: FAD-dependent oxidoreductase [Lentisphaeria bacterium]
MTVSPNPSCARWSAKSSNGTYSVGRKQDKTRIPLDRLLAAKAPISRETRLRLQKLRAETNPRALKRSIQQKLNRIYQLASFKRYGGWVLDTQFYQQTGGCYLLAHGMGKPVKNASTEVNIPTAGNWYIFVRTRDWCPGNWDAPGQFEVLLNGKPVDTVFGTEEGLAWQRGGKVKLPAGEIKVELHDLTGFEGRADAVYFSPVPDPELPVKAKDVVAWKDVMSGRNSLKVDSEDFDVVIVGGGISGCAAALAADEKGLKVALVHDRPVFGGNASAEIRVHTEGIHGKGGKILEKIDTAHWPNGSVRSADDQQKRDDALQKSGVNLFPDNIAVGLEKKGNHIASVDARNSKTGIISRYKAPVFIDATGDGWLGFCSGCECRYGREAYTEFGEKWAKHGDLWSPEEADKKVMGSSVLWNSEEKSAVSTFPEVPWAMPVSEDRKAVKGEWYWEYSDNDLDQIEDAELIRDHMFRAIYGNFYNAKEDADFAKTALQFVAYLAGRRESRRIMGDYIYTMRDIAEKREFPDTVAEETRSIDCHFQRKEEGEPADYLSEALFYRQKGLYFIPFRSLYSKDISNLMMAGRCFSCSHVGLGGPRVMNTCGQMGIATGYAAALCKKHRTTPREVGRKYIKELRTIIGY